MIKEINENLCTGCGICVEICPEDVLRIDEESGRAIIRYHEDCLTCFACELQCPVHAINVHLSRRPVPQTLILFKEQDS